MFSDKKKDAPRSKFHIRIATVHAYVRVLSVLRNCRLNDGEECFCYRNVRVLREAQKKTITRSALQKETSEHAIPFPWITYKPELSIGGAPAQRTYRAKKNTPDIILKREEAIRGGGGFAPPSAFSDELLKISHLKAKKNDDNETTAHFGFKDDKKRPRIQKQPMNDN